MIIQDPTPVWVVTYTSPYPEDGGCVEVVGAAASEGGAYRIAYDAVVAVNRNSPITHLDRYDITRHELRS